MRTAYCFDLDGTLTLVEILPSIASELGISDEIATLTRATIDGHIPFQDSFRLRCLILGQIPAERIREIVSDIPLNEPLFEFVRERRENCFLVTGNVDIWIQPLVERCGAQLYSSKGKSESGKFSLTSILNKTHAIEDIRKNLGYSRIVAVGDGANDAGMLELADVGIAYGGVHSPAPSAVAAADYVVHSGDSLCRLLNTL